MSTEKVFRTSVELGIYTEDGQLTEPYKSEEKTAVMYIIVNKDLGMPVGKLAAQVGHGVQEMMSNISVFIEDMCYINSTRIKDKKN